MKRYITSKLIGLFTLLSLLFFVLSCSSVVDNEDIVGLHWDDMIGTTWYIMEGSGTAMERWTFYRDSVVVDIDHFSKDGNEFLAPMEAHYREKHIGEVCTKDVEMDYWIGDGVQIYRCTELQWKRYTPSGNGWTPVYSWSVYQMWVIEHVFEGLAYIGNAPDSFEFSKIPLVEIKYPEGWIHDTM